MSDLRYVTEGQEKILALFFSHSSFGYALMNSPIEVMDKGVIQVVPNNPLILRQVKRLLKRTKPHRIVIEDHTGNQSNKSERVSQLLNSIKRFAKERGIPLSAYSREQIREVFSNWNAKTKHDMVRVISKNIYAYQNMYFDKPKYPKKDHYRYPLFDSASLGVTHYYICH